MSTYVDMTDDDVATLMIDVPVNIQAHREEATLDNNELNFVKSLMCPVCCEVLKDPVATPCGHTLCKECWERHVKNWTGCSRNLCPICNRDVPDNLEINKTLKEIVLNVHGERTSVQTSEDLLDWRVWKNKPLPTHRAFKFEFADLTKQNYWSVGVSVTMQDCEREVGVNDRYIYVSSLKADRVNRLCIQYDPNLRTVSFLDIDTDRAFVRIIPKHSILNLAVYFGFGSFCSIL
ncbi:hypothetical protein [Crucian carp herpesvirus]|uniref:ORF144 n=1 Tax=Cyprinid herpesvirus 2 TaxID=317878 RepID=K7PCP5_CYHV2|nr:protein ORF144 [Cyprinid herpesvirus 2]APB92987.1 hypothetical protein [Crucian carp herpesvirus]AFJ20565.1 protein ORF144 [Cyprinid herpesvirus 2]AKC02082.1 hypothetical protein [Cyprinid herpesvirus 2]AMB21709.1 ORF144 [Cyprinid herpesvirus 2]QAU54862.1 protein ORF144 [Cyprinid herpesvirus 2]